MVDLNYEEDKAVTVDFNLVATEDGEFVEVQGAGEEATFAQAEMDQMLVLSRKAISDLIAAQRAVLAQADGWRRLETVGLTSEDPINKLSSVPDRPEVFESADCSAADPRSTAISNRLASYYRLHLFEPDTAR